MSKRTVITNKGMELLASSSQATGQYWWIGYYGLAYVPNLWKADSISVPETDDCDVVNSPNTKPDEEDSYNGSWISEDDYDKVEPSMTRLTTYGDMIYNIFQGDLVGTGYYNCVSDGSAGGDLFGLTMYNTNIKKHYRYVLNEYGNNTLVAWINEPTTTTGMMLGKFAYLGTDGFVKSNMPIPAPLYYMGNTGDSSVDNYFPEFVDPEVNGSNIYPYIEIWANTPILDGLGLEPDGTNKIFVPKISVDYREYLDSQGYTEAHVYADTTRNPTNNGSGSIRIEGGQYFDTLDIPASVDSGFDNTSWFAANLTMLTDYADTGDAIECREFWKMHSISNYNRFHAPVGSTGMVLSSDLSNRNMAKVTKFFPISNYKVITTESGNNTAGDAVEFATGISLTIDLDLAPSTKANAEDTSNLTFFDKYDLGVDQTEQEYYETSGDIIQDQFSRNIFNTAHTSFKFNRIGIYAVPLRKCPFVKNVADPIGKDVTIQFEINPDTEPVLFAVVDWDNTVHIDDTGDGIHKFRAEINLNLESPGGDLDADALVRNSTIFYNLYEDDALRWYQNQLVATASTQNAITELEVKIGHIEKKVENALNVCPPIDLSKKFSAKNHNHPFDGLRHLFDGTADGSLRGVNTLKETNEITLTKNAFLTSEIEENEEYLMDRNSTVLGGENNYIHSNAESFIGAGINNSIYDSSRSFIGSGESHKIGDIVENSMIGAGKLNRIAGSKTSFIGAGQENVIKTTGSDNTTIFSYESAIVAGYQNTINTEVRSLIGAGYGNTITGQGLEQSYNYRGNCAILNGLNNSIMYASHSAIIGGEQNLIDGTSDWGSKSTCIVGGAGNRVTGIAPNYNAFIAGGEDNKIENTLGSVTYHNTIIGGSNNSLYDGKSSSILGGYSHEIIDSNYSTILGGYNGYIHSADNVAIIGGKDNRILEGADYAIAKGYGAVATAYAEEATANGVNSFAGSRQKSNLLYSGIVDGDEYVTGYLYLDNTSKFYDFRKNYTNRYVSFSGKIDIMGMSATRTYTYSDIVFTTVIKGGGSALIEFSFTDPGLSGSATYTKFYFGTGPVERSYTIIISGAASGINGTYQLTDSNILCEPGYLSLNTGVITPTTITAPVLTTVTIEIIEQSTLKVTNNFIGHYNGSDNSSYIYSERTKYDNNKKYLSSGLFVSCVGSYIDYITGGYWITADNIVPAMDAAGNLYIITKSIPVANIKWIANMELLNLAENIS